MDQSEGVEEWERVGVQPVALTELVESASPCRGGLSTAVEKPLLVCE